MQDDRASMSRRNVLMMVSVVLLGGIAGFASTTILLPDRNKEGNGNVKVRPIHQLKLTGSRHGLGVWSPTGRDPQFLIKRSIGLSSFGAGRYEMRLVSSEQPALFDHAVLFFDRLNGFNERDKLRLKFSRNPGDKHLVAKFELPTSAHRLRFDPVTQRRAFTLGSIVVRQLVAYSGV